MALYILKTYSVFDMCFGVESCLPFCRCFLCVFAAYIQTSVVCEVFCFLLKIHPVASENCHLTKVGRQ